MATVSEKTQHGYADADEFIQYQLEQARSRIKATDLLTASVLAGLLLIGYILTFTLLDHWVVDGGFSPGMRAGMLTLVVTLCAAILFRYVVRPWFRTIHPLYAARMLDRSSQGLEGSLLALVDLQAGGRKSDSPIQRTLEKRAAVKLAEIHVDEAIDRRLLIRMGTALFAVTLLTCLYAVFSPKAISLLRPLTLAQASVATRTVVESVQPGNKTVPAGSQVEFIADIAGVVPEEVQVLFTTADRRFVDEPLKMRPTDDQNRFQVIMAGDGDRGLRQNLTYRVVAGDASSEVFTISVDQPPTSRVTEIHYQYPSYMDLPERVDSSGTIDAWEGTTVTIHAESSVPVESAILQLSDDAAFTNRGEEVAVSVKEKTLSAELNLESRQDGSLPKFYRIRVTDADGNSDPDPIVYAMEIRKDQPPIVKLLDPTRDLQVAANAIIPLLIEAEDPDFLLRSVTLHYSVNGKPIQPSEVLLDTSRTALPKRWADSWDFRLTTLKLNPGDLVTYHVEARDNRPPLGNQSRTGDLNLQIMAPISDEAVQEQLAQDREMQQQQLQDRVDPKDPSQQNAQETDPSETPAAPTEPSEAPVDTPAEETPAEEVPADGAKEKSKPGEGDQSKPTKGNEGSQKSGAKPSPSKGSREGNTGESSSEQTSPDSKSGGQENNKRRANDDEALQKLIEKMNRNEKPDGNGSDDAAPKNESEEENGSKPEQKNGGQSAHENPEENNSKKAQPEDPNEAEKGSEEQSASGENQPTAEESSESMKTGENENSADSENTTPESGTEQSTETGEDNPKEPKAGGSGEPMPQESATDAATDSDPKKPADDSNASDKNESESKSGESKSGESKSGESKSGESKSGESKSGESKSGESKSGESKSGESKTGESKTGESKSGESKSGESKSGESKSGESKSGESKSGESKSGESKSGESKSGESKSGESKSGESKSGESKSGESKSGESKSGESKSGESKSGESKSGESKSGESKTGESKTGESKTGESKTGESKSGESKSGESKSGESKSGESKSGESKSGESKSGESKSGESKSGESKSGESKSGESKSGESKSGESKSGESKSGESKSGESKSGESKSGGGQSGQGKPGEGKPGSGKGRGKAGMGKSGEGAAGGDGQSTDGPAAEDSEGGSGGSSEAESTPAKDQDPQVDEAAQAADLALRRLQKELDRGEIDPKLLEELGWTKEELAAFKDRLSQQLEARQLNEQQKKEKSLSQKSFEEMLRSLDVNSTGTTREGLSDKDRDVQDTTIRQTTVPGQYQEKFKRYQRSASGLKNKPTNKD